MVIFLLGEDRAYLSWLAHHRNGFVLDWLRRPTRKKPVVHRATCAEIKAAKSKKTHWTTGRHIKACSLDLDELVRWAKEESGDEPECCESCKPTDDSTVALSSGQRDLTKLQKEIVDYVVEAAVVHLDQHAAGYEMTVADIAKYLDKTPRQISSALIQLASHGYLKTDPEVGGATWVPVECTVFPTSDAMRMLPAFARMSKRNVEHELDNLTEQE